MVYLSEFNVGSFRGISDLKINHLSDVNLILGDNNCGKTSLLESIMLLRNTDEFLNILKVSRMRNNVMFSSRLSAYSEFLYLFNPKKEKKQISVSGVLKNNPISFEINGKIEKVVVDYTLQRNYRNYMRDRSIIYYDSKKDNELDSEFESDFEEEVNEFQGTVVSEYGTEKRINELKINEASYFGGAKISRYGNIEVEYCSPVDYVTGRLFGRILREQSYKKLVISILKLFDKDIEDLLYLKSDQTGRTVEYVFHKELGNMPLSSFGDGLKKVLSLASSIARAADGILLIDEIDTSIHSKYYDDIFNFVIKACAKFNIQLFVTTHSIEAIDGFLASQDYDSNKKKRDIMRVITLRKEENQTLSRVLTGKEAFREREDYGLEVRI